MPHEKNAPTCKPTATSKHPETSFKTLSLLCEEKIRTHGDKISGSDREIGSDWNRPTSAFLFGRLPSSGRAVDPDFQPNPSCCLGVLR
ncbi:uncharacterized [Tachysurus ichikawai]